jgi:hypothetical protein
MRLLCKWIHIQRKFELLYFCPSSCSSDFDEIWYCSLHQNVLEVFRLSGLRISLVLLT